MFTGIIEQIGIVKNFSRTTDTYRLTIQVAKNLDLFKKGNSLSINGICLTLVDIKENLLSFDVMSQTFRKTSFAYLKRNDRVNIEGSLKADSRLDGHFVLGHVDKAVRILAITKGAKPYIDIPIFSDDKIYVVTKGSIAIDGISLTIGEIYGGRIRIYLIPYTLENTTLKYKKAGDWVNVEFDILGKYVKNKGFI